MKDDLSTANGSRGLSEIDRLKAQMDRLDREKKKLQDKLVAKAADAEKADTAGGSKKKRRQAKPKKRVWKEGRPKLPYPDFPLSPHASGKWVKKIKGRPHYFGRWAKVVSGKLERIEGDGWEEALAVYKAQADDLHAGRTPEDPNDAVTVKSLCDQFYAAKKKKFDSNRLSPRTLEEYDATCERLVAVFGRHRRIDKLRPADFQTYLDSLPPKWGLIRRGNEIQRVRTVFNFGLACELIRAPARFGPDFTKPTKSEVRKYKNDFGEKLFTADEVRRLINAGGTSLKAMILLGINCAFGNTDIAKLPKARLDLKEGWVNFPRPKTGIKRRCPLWPETLKATKAAIAARPEPSSAEHSDLVFVTKYGGPWAEDGRSDAVTREFSRLLHKLGINLPEIDGARNPKHRRNLNFYSLRHTFRTVADATRDLTAVRSIMGHADHSIDAEYTHGVEDSRLKAVTDHVHDWVFPPKKAKAKGGRKAGAK